ncbi:PAS domain-containing protein [Rhodocytophaga aerolata]|uniref:PAS domain-containing protein n=1 Tax=Rhodocytophaga aerolata TaxID=455078 RepID=A0ABT8R1K9_9BACT|nr:PAS domain-containing protein [Rhodocytophaga aerolata]MDO1445983.1 PAS domain-containing protein [Rhodocytophaga aerolata]
MEHIPILPTIDWRDFLSGILPHVEEGVAALDNSGRILYCSPAFRAIAQKSAQQVQGEVLQQIFDGPTSAR